MIVAMPFEMLPLFNEKVQKYDIRLAIHNHGPGDKVFPVPDGLREDQRARPPHRPVHRHRPHGSRRRRSEPGGRAVRRPAVRGPYEGRLRRQGEGQHDRNGPRRDRHPPVPPDAGQDRVRRHLSFEYEKDADDPLPGLAESVGYVRGVSRQFSRLRYTSTFIAHFSSLSGSFGDPLAGNS